MVRVRFQRNICSSTGSSRASLGECDCFRVLYVFKDIEAFPNDFADLINDDTADHWPRTYEAATVACEFKRAGHEFAVRICPDHWSLSKS